MKTRIGRWFATAFVALISVSVPVVMSQDSPAERMPIIDYQTRFLPTIARSGMVVAPERLAAEVGTDILKRGGNAIDAAVATGFALAVTYPRAGNIGGGGFMLIHRAKDNRQTLIDYREKAPAAATADLYLDEAGNVDRQREFFSHQSAGVPGTVAGMLYALEHYGSLSLAEVLELAIGLAAEGIAVSFALNYEINSRAERLEQNPEAARLFLDASGSAPAIGTTLRQPELAWTLRQIAERGREGFYAGEVAKRIAADMADNDGLITQQDLAAYRAVEREPVRGTYRDFAVVSTPPPSSGGVHILQMLNILEGYDLAAMGH
ncbi:MAG: gamma-glutamyltransferase, partial [Chromatocurvus sp.]